MKEASVHYLANRGEKTTRIIIDWPDGGYSEFNAEIGWQSRWGNGEMVKVEEGSDHALICDAISLRTRMKGAKRKNEVIYLQK